jgi:hypothetical protein
MKNEELVSTYKQYIQKFKFYSDIPNIIFTISCIFIGIFFLFFLVSQLAYDGGFVFAFFGAALLVGFAYLNRFLTEVLISATIIRTIESINNLEKSLFQGDATAVVDSKKALKDIL